MMTVVISAFISERGKEVIEHSIRSVVNVTKAKSSMLWMYLARRFNLVCGVKALY